MAKPPSASRTETTHFVLPPATNALGTIFGGTIMQWIDEIAAVAASRHAGGIAVTAAVDALQFMAPIGLGDLVVLRASVNAVFRTSMEVGVLVEVEDPRTGARRRTTKAYLTFVAVDAVERKPRVLEPLAPATDDERRREADAKARRTARLAARSR
ncbi:MAG: acyl-CoA thioesterase [Deltaproteobacteria bacterium]|nr:acyl-CoA thioesterase [Deltaproteobacteria bacterium]